MSHIKNKAQRHLQLACASYRLGLTLSLMVMTLTHAMAQEGPETPTLRAPKYGGPDRWENGLDVKTTAFYDEKPSIGGSSPIILSAQWNRKFETATYLGLTASSMAQPAKGPFTDMKSDIMTYYGGLNLGQSLFESSPFRVTANISAGMGSMFIRTQPEGDASRMNRADYRFIEPGGFITFFDYAGLEFGLVATFRYVRLISEYSMDGRILGRDGDFSSQAFGLTFRTQRR